MIKKHPFDFHVYKTHEISSVIEIVDDYKSIEKENVGLFSITKDGFKLIQGDVYRIVKNNTVSYYLVGFHKKDNVINSFGLYQLQFKENKTLKTKTFFHKESFDTNIWEKFEDTERIQYIGNIFLHDIVPHIEHLIDLTTIDESVLNFNEFIIMQNDIEIYSLTSSSDYIRVIYSAKNIRLFNLKLLFKLICMKKTDWTISFAISSSFITFNEDSQLYTLKYDGVPINLGDIFLLNEDLKEIDIYKEFKDVVSLHRQLTTKNSFNPTCFTIILNELNQFIIIDLTTSTPKEFNYEDDVFLFSPTHYTVIKENDDLYENQLIKLI